MSQRVRPGDRLVLLRDAAASGIVLSASLGLPQGPINQFTYYRSWAVDLARSRSVSRRAASLTGFRQRPLNG
jgi:hypothetical protein